MSIGISIIVDTAEIDRILGQIPAKKAQIGKEIGSRAEGYAKMRAPYDIGYLYNATWAEFPGGNILARIATHDCEYAVYQELGFHHWISGQFIQNPYLVPAVEQVSGEYFSPGTWRRLFE